MTGVGTHQDSEGEQIIKKKQEQALTQTFGNTCNTPGCTNTTQYNESKCQECNSFGYNPLKPPQNIETYPDIDTLPPTPTKKETNYNYRCPNCGGEFKTFDGAKCPFCQTAKGEFLQDDSEKQETDEDSDDSTLVYDEDGDVIGLLTGEGR